MSIRKHSLYLGMSNVLSLGLNFLSGIFLTRLLGAEGRGVLSKLEAGAGLLAQLTTLKSHMGFIYFVANKKIDSRKLFGLAILTILGSLILSGIFLFILNQTGNGGLVLPIGYLNGFFVFYSLLLFLLTESQIIFSAFLRGVKSFRDVYISQIAVSVFRLVLFASVFFLLGKSQIPVKSGILLHLVVLGASLITTLYFFKKTFKINPSFKLSNSGDVIPFFSFVSVSYLALLTNFLMKSIDIWIVEYYYSSVELGYYSVAVNLSLLLMVFPSTIREVFIPYLASSDQEENLKNLKFFSRVSFTGIFIIALVMFLLSDYLIPFLYGEEFTNSVHPFKYLVIAIVVASIGIIFSAYNYGTGIPKLNFYANAISLLVMIVLDLWLIPDYGIEGASIASLATYVTNSFLIFLTVFLKQKLPFTNYLFVTWRDLQEIKRFKRG